MIGVCGRAGLQFRLARYGKHAFSLSHHAAPMVVDIRPMMSCSLHSVGNTGHGMLNYIPFKLFLVPLVFFFDFKVYFAILKFGISSIQSLAQANHIPD